MHKHYQLPQESIGELATKLRPHVGGYFNNGEHKTNPTGDGVDHLIE